MASEIRHNGFYPVPNRFAHMDNTDLPLNIFKAPVKLDQDIALPGNSPCIAEVFFFDVYLVSIATFSYKFVCIDCIIVSIVRHTKFLF